LTQINQSRMKGCPRKVFTLTPAGSGNFEGRKKETQKTKHPGTGKEGAVGTGKIFFR